MKQGIRSKNELKILKDRLDIYKSFHILVAQIHRTHSILSLLRNPNYRKMMEYSLSFWGTIFYSIQDKLIINLSEIYGIDKNNKKVTISKLLKNIDDADTIRKIEDILRRRDYIKCNIKNWRDNLSAHKNHSYFRDSGRLEKERPIVLGEMDDLVSDLIEILHLSQKSYLGKEINDYQKDFYDEYIYIKQEVNKVMNLINFK